MAPLKEMSDYDDERRQAKFALTEIHGAESAVNEAKRQKIDVEEAVALLEQAKVRYDSNEFQRAVELTLQCKRIIYDRTAVRR